MIPWATRPVPVTAKTIGDYTFGSPPFSIFFAILVSASYIAS
jgi:hypothetical protein